VSQSVTLLGGTHFVLAGSMLIAVRLGCRPVVATPNSCNAIAAIPQLRQHPTAVLNQSSTASVRQVTARSIPVSGPSGSSGGVEVSGAPAGQISSELMDSMRSKIAEALQTSSVTVQDVYGDGRHVSIDVVSPMFEGKNAVQRQRMVYKVCKPLRRSWLDAFDRLQEVHTADCAHPRL
jgi:stress-induced morphogen